MTERAMYFGRGGNLLGLLSTPDDPLPGAPAVVLLNAGLLHRVGPNRMNVELARRLSNEGITSLRFDISGIGDSEIVDASLLYFQRAIQDIVDSLDTLEKVTGIGEFVVIGLCTGAFNALGAARQDERVKGIVLLDGYSYPTLKSQLKHYSRQALKPEKWRSAAEGLIGARSDPGDKPRDMAVFRNEEMPKERFASEMSRLLDRNLRMMLVYTGLGPLSYNYREQLQDALPGLPIDDEVRVVYYPGADHTFTIKGNREKLYDAIQSWLSTEFAERVS